MLEMVSLAMNEVFYYVYRIVVWLSGSSSFGVVFWIGTAIAIIFIVIKLIRSIVWGS